MPATGLDAEQTLDRLIERRAQEARESGQGRRLEEAWRASERREKERQRAENREAWRRFYSRLARSHAAMSAEFERRALALERQGGRW